MDMKCLIICIITQMWNSIGSLLTIATLSDELAGGPLEQPLLLMNSALDFQGPTSVKMMLKLVKPPTLARSPTVAPVLPPTIIIHHYLNVCKPRTLFYLKLKLGC